MPEPSRHGFREFLPSANQALADLEATTGKPVQIVEAPDLKVLATIHRAGPQDASHVLRIQGGENRLADYLIVFECRMALRDGAGPRAVLTENRQVRERVMGECAELHSHLPPAKAPVGGAARHLSASPGRRRQPQHLPQLAGGGTVPPA